MALVDVIGSFKLTVGSLSFTLPKGRFTGRALPRDRIDGPGLEYSIAGNPVQTGVFYEPKSIWEMEFLATPAEEDQLLLLYNYWLLTKPHPQVILHDYTETVQEPTQARALATDSTIATLVTPSGWKEYYAQFSVHFLAKPKRTKEGQYRTISLRLQELKKIAP